MSEFGDFTASSTGAPADGSANPLTSDDPTADFLAREQAILGADAALFGNDLAAAGSDNAPVAASGFGDFGGAPSSAGFEVVPAGSDVGFANEPSFANDASFATDFAAATPIPFSHTGISSTGSMGSVPQPREPELEPEVIKQWREEFSARIAERDARSKAKTEELLNNAKDAIERFYAEYNDKKNKAINRNKEQEKRAIAERDDVTSGTVWDRVVRQIEQTTTTTSAASTKGKVDLKPNRPADDKNKDKKDAKAVTKTRDTARMKQLLISLRKDPKAPGVEASA